MSDKGTATYDILTIMSGEETKILILKKQLRGGLVIRYTAITYLSKSHM